MSTRQLTSGATLMIHSEGDAKALVLSYLVDHLGTAKAIEALCDGLSLDECERVERAVRSVRLNLERERNERA